MRHLYLFFLFILACPFAQAQNLYMPRDVQQAFKNGTRSPDGQPGRNYWQNTGKYDITITAMPPDRTIKGSEQIAYTNNSPDTLKSIVIRLTQNIHKPGAVRNSSASPDYLSTGTIIDSFAVNGQPQPWKDRNATWQQVQLPQPLLPHSTVQLRFAWHFDVSVESGREGMIDATTYFLAYFYPRVSVYDDYNGWDKIDFTDQQEFYSDFNDYTLKVKVPKNYIVWATGTLQNPDQVLQPAFAQKLRQSMQTDSVLHIVTAADLAARRVTTQNAVNTWTWTATDIPDMALGLSDHYLWDAGSVVVDDATNRRASVQSAYSASAADFRHAVKVGQHALNWFSRNWPGVPYPYPKTTLFQGYADMEYPMMVNDTSVPDLTFAQFVAEHEIAHTWFPFYMGINESRYAFMDEGWATTLELLINRADMPREAADEFFRQFRVSRWIHDRSMEEDLPIITPANVLKGTAYGNNAYGKPALGYLAVKDLLGDALFKKCLHAYVDRWHGKHPLPWDFFNTFNNVSGQNLNWFWHNWFFTNGYIDLAIQDVKQKRKTYTVTVQNIGGFAAPFDVQVKYSDGSTDTLHQTAAIWRNNPQQASIKIPTKKKVQSVALAGGIFMDADEGNNLWPAGSAVSALKR
ncbi:M1 family metallopeptidase [Pontibacter liquoris]|uniref:M1 family metallopeptidase n=1 Tax=Pontibacter liquoris TaxID=2905677 RepID=UPI001FA78757|nr:M1 family metallopeptidase [Pontibacter liquoris]